MKRPTRSHPSGAPAACAGFTLIELLVVIAIIGILAGMLLPSLSAAKSTAKRVACTSGLKQLGYGLRMYIDDNEHKYPARGPANTNRWPLQLYNYYQDTKILRCPSDSLTPNNFGNGMRDRVLEAPRSYIINGFNDYFQGYPTNGAALPEQAIVEYSETIVFGEKETESGHWYMDYWPGDDFRELEQSRHTTSRRGTGGSVYLFADSSARYLRFGASWNPINMWFIDPALRKLGAN